MYLSNPLTPINTFMQLLVMYTTLGFNRIYSKNQFFDKRCSDLEVWLKHRSYNEKLVRQQILKTRKYRRTELLYSQREEVHKNKLVFNITYYLIVFET